MGRFPSSLIFTPSSNPLPQPVQAPGKLVDFGFSRNFPATFRIERPLGRGQFGKTFVATRIATGQQVAIKRMDKNKMFTHISVENVRREVTIMCNMPKHANVVEFYDAFEDDDFIYIAMELCLEGELYKWILSKRSGQYSEKDATNIVKQMLNAVAHCHLHGVVHRDLKPQNFLFQTDGVLKLADFGLSAFIVTGQPFQDVVGTAFYVAPEVLTKRSGPESDLWSLGVITYQLISGALPFSEKTADAIFEKVLCQNPEFGEKAWSSVSSSAKDFVQKLLVKDPRTRLTAAKALSHPWIRDEEVTDIPLDISVLSSIYKFETYKSFRKIALRVLTSVLSADELTNLHDQFNAIDKNKNGKLSYSEIYEALTKYSSWNLHESKIFEILQAMDTNNDGLIDSDEFAAAALHLSQLNSVKSSKWYERCHRAFEKLDTNKNGYIEPEELKLYSSSFLSLIEEADIDNDGRLNFLEFQRLLR